MVIKLIKEHILVQKLLPVNHRAEVTYEIGKKLIDAGIAKDVTFQYKIEAKKQQKAETKARKTAEAKEKAESELAIIEEAKKLTDKK